MSSLRDAAAPERDGDGTSRRQGRIRPRWHRLNDVGDVASMVLHWNAIIPVKTLARAKSRMVHLSQFERSELVVAMLADVLAATTSAVSVNSVFVVTSDVRVAQLAMYMGAHAVEDTGTNLNAAILEGVAEAKRRNDEAAVAVLMADLPSLTPADLDEALAIAGRHRRGYVPDASGLGTTMLSAAPGVQLVPQFGDRSAHAHLESGAGRISVVDPRVRQDVDTEADLHVATCLGLGKATRSLTNGAYRARWCLAGSVPVAAGGSALSSTGTSGFLGSDRALTGREGA